MSLRGTIRRPDNRPLGTEQDVMRRLSDAFPGVRFEYQAEPPPGLTSARKYMPIFLRLWLAVFGVKTRYPNHHGYFDPGTGGAVEFYFLAKQPVHWITATAYGMTAGLNDNFDQLSAVTGWKIVYPRF